MVATLEGLFILWALPAAVLFAMSMVGHMHCSVRRKQFREHPISMIFVVVCYCLIWPKYFIVDPWVDTWKARKHRRKPPR
jgi:hypothetical protein